jgi:Zn-dependent protease with chaperone function
VLILAGSLLKIRRLAAGGCGVAELLGGRRIEPGPTDPDEQKLRNVVEEMSIASGTVVPELFVLDHERGINAFAAGHTRSDVALGVTRGCVKLLTRDELQGVIAHEFSHILNGDTRLNMRLMGIVHGVLWPVIVGRILVRGSDRPAYLGESILDEELSVWRLPLIPVGIVLILIGAIGLPFVRLLKSAICREREWLADAAAVQFTRYPGGIAGALKKIGGLDKAGRLDTAHAESASHLYFASSSFPPWFGFLATHPPLVKRITAIEPGFDGHFPRVKALPPSQFERDQAAVEAIAQVLALEKAHPECLVSTVGQPTIEHIRQANMLRLGLPAEVSNALRSPVSAMALIYALLISSDENTCAGQLALLGNHLPPDALQPIHALLPTVANLEQRVKLPLIDLALPALRHLAPEDYLQFSGIVRALIEYDQAIDLFEYTLQRILFRHLRPYYESVPRTRFIYPSVGSLLNECSIVLSALAHVGQADDTDAAAAFDRGAGYLSAPEGSVQFLTGEARDLAHVDDALDRLAQAVASVRRNVLLACAQTVAADGQVQAREMELLRAIAESLDCPVPPFVEALEDSTAADAP